MLKAWMDFAFDSALLCAEAQEVMGLRLMKLLGGGGDAGREALLMVAEKSVVFTDAASELAAGAPLALCQGQQAPPLALTSPSSLDGESRSFERDGWRGVGACPPTPRFSHSPRR
jgi:hypothetical protein